MKKKIRIFTLLLALISLVGMLPASAASDTITLHFHNSSGTHYESDALGSCKIHIIEFDTGTETRTGFCASHGKDIGNSLRGQTWEKTGRVTDPTIETLMAYYYAHTTGVFTGKAVALGEDVLWDDATTWLMNAWTQAMVWRWEAGTITDPVVDCAEELLPIWNFRNGTEYESIDDVFRGGNTFRMFAQYVLDMGEQDVWGGCVVYSYHFTGPGSKNFKPENVQDILLGELEIIIAETYSLVVRKVDATNPALGLQGAKFHIEAEDGTFAKDVVTSSDGTYRQDGLNAGVYIVTELAPPEHYELSNAAPQFVVLPSGGSTTATVTFEDKPVITGTGSIRKVDADNPTVGLAGAVIRITGVDNSFTGTYTTAAGGYLLDLPWATMPVGSYVAEEIAPPTGYTLSSDPAKVRQTFQWDGHTEVDLLFTNDAMVKVQLVKLDDAGRPLPGAVFAILKDGQVVGTEATDAAGKITVPNVTEGFYAFKELSAPTGYVKLDHPVLVYVDQATVNGGGTVTVTATDAKLPSLTIRKTDADTGEPVMGATFTLKRADGATITTEATRADGSVTIRSLQPGVYTVTEQSVPANYILDSAPQQVTLEPGRDATMQFQDHQRPTLVIRKTDIDGIPLAGAVFEVRAKDGPLVGDFTVGEDGSVTVPNTLLDVGYYLVTEKLAPEGYILDTEAHEIFLKPGQATEIVVANQRKPDLTILKLDSVVGDGIKGAKFEIFVAKDNAPNGTFQRVGDTFYFSDENGVIALPELDTGWYKIVEIEPPEGYSLAGSEQIVYVEHDKGTTVTFENVPKSALVIRKTNAAGQPLAGAWFRVRYLGGTSGSGGTIIGEYSTSASGSVILTGLAVGTYICEEISAPEGYVIDAPTQTAYISGRQQDCVMLTFTDTKKGSLLIVKKDAATGAPLSDVQFYVTDSDGSVIGTSNGYFTTDSAGCILIPDLDPGVTLVVKEVRAKEGYILDDSPQTIKIKAGETVTLEFRNRPQGAIIVYKKDSVTGRPLEGVEFRLTTASGALVGNGTYFTDADGIITLSPIEPGAYALTELATIPGYVIREATRSQTVTVGTGETKEITVLNDPTATLVIHKYIAGTANEPLAGVAFKVTDGSGGAVGSDGGTYYTDAAGTITLTGLQPGTAVTVQEVRTVEGYVLDGTPQSVLIKGGEVQSLTFWNAKAGVLIIRKLDSVTGKPVEGAEFQLTYADGRYVDNANGHLSSNGLYSTDKNGEIRISGVVGTIVVRETKAPDGYAPDPTPQTVTVNPSDEQTLTFYDDPVGGVEIIKVSAADKTKRIPGVTFELRRMDGGLVKTVTTGSNGRVFASLDAGDYYAVEVDCPSNYKLDATPQYFTVESGKTTTLTIENAPFSGILIRKYDSTTGKGIQGVTFLLYDSSMTPIGQYTSDNGGFAYIEGLSNAGRYYLRELDNPGYMVDTQLKTVYVQPGETTLIEWANTPVTGQIQITKKSADYNPVNGLLAGTPLEGAVFEIYDRANNVVDTIVTDSRGLAASKPLPLDRYTVREVRAPAHYIAGDETLIAYLDHAGQIVRFEVTNRSVQTGVTITKTGPVETMAGQPVRYVLSGIGNTSNVSLDSFFWRDVLPAEVRLNSIVTGTYNFPGAYKIVYRVNGGDYRLLADNLDTQRSYTLSTSTAVLGLTANERVTEVMFLFGQAPAGFANVEKPMLYCTATGSIAATTIVNEADVGGVYDGAWVQAVARWETRVYRKIKTLPRTGY